MNKISVIVPIYNAPNEAKLLLQSLANNFNFYFGEILLINDCSKKETTDYLTTFVKKNPQFTLINNRKNLGYVKTCNKGMERAKGDIIVLLNSDTIIPSQFCERIIKCFNSDEKIGTASPISSRSAKYFISMPDNMSPEEMNVLLRKSHKCIYPPILAAEGFCYCIRKEVIEQQGYFDEIYGKGYHEETDYSLRASINGWKNVLIDDLYIFHKRCCSFGEENKASQLKANDSILKSRYSTYKKIIKKDLDIDITDKIKKEMFSKRITINLFGIKIKFKR